MAYAFNPETLYDKTDNGLEILKYFLVHCKDFDKAVSNQKMPFQFRDNDDTLSSYLVNPDKKLKGDAQYWRFKDYGDEFYTPIKLAMEKTGLDFYPCLKHLYQTFNIVEGKSFFQAETVVKALDKEDKRQNGWWNIEFKKEHHNLTHIGRFVTPEIAEKYHFKSVDFYEKVFIKKDTGLLTYIKITATDSFPIFAYSPDNKTWCKTYAPLSNDKQYKHGYLGKKPARYVHGLEQIRKDFNAYIDNLNKQIKKAVADKNEYLSNELTLKRNTFQFDNVMICTGGSDGLNVASLGYDCIWFNSESEQISHEEYNELKKYCKQIYNLPDVDTQGVKYAYEVAENFWQMKSIWLPKEKLGTNGKDFRDWMKFYANANIEAVKYQFLNLITGALQMKFFEINEKKTVKIRPSYLHYFLKVKGFNLYYPEKQFTDKVAEQEYIFIRIEENIVTQVFPNQIRKFCERYLIAKGQNTFVIDQIKTTVQFTDKNLLGLDDIKLDFKNYSLESQTFFFNNLTATVTADGIKTEPYKSYQNFVWNDAILKNDILPEAPFFKHTIDENGNDKLQILREDCDYMNFLVNTSRMFWRKELETPFAQNQQDEKTAYHSNNRFNIAGENLTEEEKDTQAKHFLNKCFSIGYLLHKQKRQSFAKVVYTIDDKAKDSEEDANGRSGKSIIFYGIDQLRPNRFLIDGKNKNLTTDKHVLHGLTKENDYLYIEDLDQYTSFEFFYNWITGSLVVNPKNTKPYEIKFFDVPKMAVTSNYGLPKVTPSTLGRLLFMSVSDYYHVKTDHYLEERKVSSDFGYDLFSLSWDKKQWNIFYNFLMQCLQMYLQNFDHEINAPQSNIDINNAMASMGDVFMEWCESYFQKTQTIDVEKEIIGMDSKPTIIIEQETITGTLNEYVSRSVMQDSYSKRAGKFSKTSANFKKSLQQYCKIKGYTLNPKELCGSDGFIKRPIVDEKNKRQIVEHFFIKTPDNSLISEQQQEAPTNEKTNKSNDLPF